MSNFKITATMILSTFVAAGATTAAPTGPSADYGSAVRDSAAARVIRITAATKYLNVTNGETVTIEAEGKSFTWYVNTYPNVNNFDLSKIAPKDMETVHGVKVYVAANLAYFGA